MEVDRRYGVVQQPAIGGFFMEEEMNGRLTIGRVLKNHRDRWRATIEDKEASCEAKIFAQLGLGIWRRIVEALGDQNPCMDPDTDGLRLCTEIEKMITHAQKQNLGLDDLMLELWISKIIAELRNIDLLSRITFLETQYHWRQQASSA